MGLTVEQALGAVRRCNRRLWGVVLAWSETTYCSNSVRVSAASSCLSLPAIGSKRGCDRAEVNALLLPFPDRLLEGRLGDGRNIGGCLFTEFLIPLPDLLQASLFALFEACSHLGNEGGLVDLLGNPANDKPVDPILVFREGGLVMRREPSSIWSERLGLRMLSTSSLSTLAFLADLPTEAALDPAPASFLGGSFLGPSLMEGEGTSEAGAGSSAGLAAPAHGEHLAHPNCKPPILWHLPAGTEVEEEEAEAGAEAGAAVGSDDAPASVLPRTLGGAEAVLPDLTGRWSILAPEAAAKPWEYGRPPAETFAMSLAEAWALAGSVSLWFQFSRRLAE